jgi:GNAT superfamily N-acetyltransferase
MTISRFTFDDIDAFLKTCAGEGLTCDRWECEFLLQAFPQGCFVYKDDGQPVAFVTSIAYGSNGWLGNLIVISDWRGRGIGKILTEYAIESLRSAGVQSVWLAATEAGKRIYQRFGFVEVDTINQWMGFGQSGKLCDMPGMDISQMISVDLACWGYRRDSLIANIAGHGTVIAGPDAFLIAQQWNYGYFQLGPWVGKNFEIIEELFKTALIRIGPSNPIFSYVPFRNVSAAMLLTAQGFKIMGSSTLMCLGDAAYNPRNIFGLASLGLG